MSHNAKEKLCNLYQFAKEFNGIASCKIFGRSLIVPSFYNKLHLVDALFAQTHTSFGIGETVWLHQQKRFYKADTTHMVQHFPIQLFVNGGI